MITYEMLVDSGRVSDSVILDFLELFPSGAMETKEDIERAYDSNIRLWDIVRAFHKNEFDKPYWQIFRHFSIKLRILEDQIQKLRKAGHTYEEMERLDSERFGLYLEYWNKSQDAARDFLLNLGGFR